MEADGAEGWPGPSDTERSPLMIRCLRADDFPALRALDDAVANGRDAASLGEQRSARPIAQPHLTPAAFAAYVADGCCAVAALDGRVVGYLLARPLAYLDERPLSVWVDDITVEPDRRRCGIATALYRGFGEWARTAGIRAVLTRVGIDDQVGQALHRRVGFEPRSTDALIWRLDEA